MVVGVPRVFFMPRFSLAVHPGPGSSSMGVRSMSAMGFVPMVHMAAPFSHKRLSKNIQNYPGYGRFRMPVIDSFHIFPLLFSRPRQ